MKIKKNLRDYCCFMTVLVLFSCAGTLAYAGGDIDMTSPPQPVWPDAAPVWPDIDYSNAVRWNVNNLATWIEAVGGIRSGGNNQTHIITVTGTISVPPSSSTSSPDSTFGTVENVIVTLEGSGTLAVSAGNGSLFRIGKGQKVIIKDLALKGRDNSEGSVVHITGGEFIMEGKAVITDNKKKGPGGGVYVNGGTFTMKDNAAVSGNSVTSSYAGGGVYVQFGSLIMLDNAIVSGNTDGGASVDVRNGTFTMRNNASVKNNSSHGVYFTDGGTFAMTDNASVKDNNDTGVSIEDGSIFTMQDNATVSGNSRAGVVLARSAFFMKDSASVQGNSSVRGGGVYVGNKGAFTLQGNATVTGNTAASADSSPASGGGVYVNGGAFFMLDNASVSSNSAISRRSNDARGKARLRAYGGGVYIGGKGGFTMRGGTISGNTTSTVTSSNTDEQYSLGGGVYISSEYDGGLFTLEDGTVQGNTAGNGGGVFVQKSFIMQGGTVSGNTASHFGGGVYINGDFTKTGGTIYGGDEAANLKNTSGKRQGNAVYQESGPQWRNITAGPSMNPNTYGFWLNEVEELAFPSDFLGAWKRANFSNTLTVAEKTIKISSNSYTYELLDKSGDLFTIKRNSANPFSLTFKLTNTSLVISGDSGNGQDNWNGTWVKQ